MSLTYQEGIKPVLVQDPIIMVDAPRYYSVLKAGNQTTYKQWSSTSINQSSIQFSCPPPSGGILIDRMVYFYLPMRLTYTGIPANGDRLIVPTKDAPRAYPISGSIINLQSTINNQSVSINLQDMIHALQHYNNDVKVKNGPYSLTPNYCDQSQQYGDLEGAVRNPLAGYDNGIEEDVMQRGAFPYTIVQNPVGDGVNVQTAIIDLFPCEPLFLPPFYFGSNCNNGSGLFNVTSMDFNITFVNNMFNRVWSHMTNVAGTVPFLSGNIVFGGLANGPDSYSPGGNLPLMLIKYVTPQETQILSPLKPITYPYFDLQTYPTQLSPIPAGTIGTAASNNIQLSSIPRRLYVYVRNSNQALINNASLTDTFCPITNISMQFMNKNGLLSSASMMDLYKMSVKNHLNMSWTQFSGQAVKNDGTLIGTCGGPICIEFGPDCGLDSLDCAGKLGQFMLQVNITYKNISNATMSPVLYLLPVLEGTFTIPSLGRALINIGVLTSQDILDAQKQEGINYHDIQDVNGGNFFSGIKNFFSKVHDFVKKHQLLSKGLSLVPHPAAQLASKAAHTFGYGEDDGCGGVMAGEGVLVGGRRKVHHRRAGELEEYADNIINNGGVLLGGKKLSHAQLQRRLKNY